MYRVLYLKPGDLVVAAGYACRPRARPDRGCLRQVNGIIAGISGIRWAKFLAFNAIGAALWVAAWTGVGYFSGSHIDTIYIDATRYDPDLALGLGALLLAYLARRVVRVRRSRAPNPT